MSRKRCVRKVWAKINPLMHAIEGAAIASRADLDRLLVRELASLDAFTRGAAGLQEWSDMVAVNNLAQTLAGQNVGAEAMPDCHIAEQALFEAAQRFEKTQRWGLSGPGIVALRNVIEYHDLQRGSISRARYEEAIRLTSARVKSGHRVRELV